MLVLSRKVEECVDIGDDIQIRVLEVRGSRVKLAIQAPRAVSIRRSELPPKAVREQEDVTSVRFGRDAAHAPCLEQAASETVCSERALSSYVVDVIV